MKNLLKIGFVAGFTLFSTLVFAGNNDNLISLKTMILYFSTLKSDSATK
jgi:hypothetical protein